MTILAAVVIFALWTSPNSFSSFEILLAEFAVNTIEAIFNVRWFINEFTLVAFSAKMLFFLVSDLYVYYFHILLFKVCFKFLKLGWIVFPLFNFINKILILHLIVPIFYKVDQIAIEFSNHFVQKLLWFLNDFTWSYIL
jgi:hypothetical protein